MVSPPSEKLAEDHAAAAAYCPQTPSHSPPKQYEEGTGVPAPPFQDEKAVVAMEVDVDA